MKKIIPTGVNLIPDRASKVFTGKIFDVYQWDQTLYDGSSGVFEALKRPDTVSVFAVVNDKIIILEDEQPHRSMVIALPGGRVDFDDTSTLEAAKREVKEETGYEFADWKLVYVNKPLEKIEWFIYTYIASGVKKISEPHIDAGEKIKVKFLSFEEVKNLALKGEKRFTEQDVLIKASGLRSFLEAPEFVGVEVDR
ncbi:NUDIX hydrolase [Candidatus Saccharibacteria bacterium]|nr:MAG: NUDIX hydrolase [Candidatus Saccharibacteria bacterium]